MRTDDSAALIIIIVVVSMMIIVSSMNLSRVNSIAIDSIAIESEKSNNNISCSDELNKINMLEEENSKLKNQILEKSDSSSSGSPISLLWFLLAVIIFLLRFGLAKKLFDMVYLVLFAKKKKKDGEVKNEKRN